MTDTRGIDTSGGGVPALKSTDPDDPIKYAPSFADVETEMRQISERVEYGNDFHAMFGTKNCNAGTVGDFRWRNVIKSMKAEKPFQTGKTYDVIELNEGLKLQ
jgi:hypothetical protein